MNYYNPTNNSMEQEHTLLYTFQYEDAISQFVTTISGNVSGGGTMDIELDCGVTAPIDNEINKKYVLFDEDEQGRAYQYIEELKFIYPNGSSLEMAIDECSDYLVGVQIIAYMEDK